MTRICFEVNFLEHLLTPYRIKYVQYTCSSICELSENWTRCTVRFFLLVWYNSSENLKNTQSGFFCLSLFKHNVFKHSGPVHAHAFNSGKGHTISLLVATLSSADNLCKQFGPKSGPTSVGPDLGPDV